MYGRAKEKIHLNESHKTVTPVKGHKSTKTEKAQQDARQHNECNTGTQ
jgi:hypothetical protein